LRACYSHNIKMSPNHRCPLVTLAYQQMIGVIFSR
jgi:hypothetical protein